MDAEEIARLVQDLRVSNDVEKKAITITDEEAREGQKRLEKVVVGKIFSRRSITREMLRSNLPRILRARGNTEIELVGNNLFVITFSLAADKKVALEEGPWHFFQDLMILKQSKAMETPTEVEFNEITLWVQCHNVPLECMNPVIIGRIGGQVGTVVEIDVGEEGNCLGKFARVRVSRLITEPLIRCVPIKQEGLDKEVLVLLQYEKLPDFCFLCGRVGHISRDCHDDTVDKAHTRFESWLRTGRSFSGRRETNVGFRGGSRMSGSDGSASRWVATRSDFRSDKGVSSKEGLGEGNGLGAAGKCVTRAVREEEEKSPGASNSDVCMREMVLLAEVPSEGEGTGQKGDELEGMCGGLDIVVEGGGSKGAEGVKQRKGKSPLKASGLSGKGGSAKKWKRLAREPKGAAGLVVGSGASEGVILGRSRRRETLLGDEAEGEGDGERRKVSKRTGDEKYT